MVDGLFLVAADGVDQLDQLPVEDGRGIAHQLLPRLVVSDRGRLRAFGHGLDLARLLVDAVRIDGRQETADDLRQFGAPGLRPDPFLLGGVELLIEPGEASGQGRHRVLVARSHHHTHGEVLERHGRLGDERPAGGLERLRDSHGVDDHVVGLGGEG